MSLPEGFPLYPRSGYKLYNVSLALPGPDLYSTPIGPFAEKSKYPNEKSSLLFPNMEYISKFASYNIGISDFMLKSSLDQNISRIPSNMPNIKDDFSKVFDSGNKDGVGMKAIEKTILSSMFETQKPFFEIVKLATNSVSLIEDIIARISPIFGAAVVGPPRALSVRSRKPVGNGPINQNDIRGYGVNNTPVSIGYKSSIDLKNRFKEFDKLSNSKGNKIEIDNDGNSIITKYPVKYTDGSDTNYHGYITISTVYSTGEFDPNVQYQYKYVDIEADPNEVEIEDDIEEIEEDLRPEKIIIGIFDAEGNPINPRDKIKYWDVSPNGEVYKAESIFEKASWIYQTDKWVLDKSIFSGYSWRTISPELFYWKNTWGSIVIQSESPGESWNKLKYGEVEDYNNEDKKIYQFRENDYISDFTQGSIDEYINYYDDYSKLEMSKHNLTDDDKIELTNQLKEVYNNNVISEQLKNITSMGKMKISYYSGMEEEDWYKYNSIPVLTGTYSDFDSRIRKTFKPMKFNIGGKEVWIDPETDYNYKLIRVDSSPNIEYISPSGNEPSVVKTSYINEFVKNRFSIKVTDLVNGSVSDKLFSIDVQKNGLDFESYSNILEYNLTNWNVEFDNSDLTKKDENQYHFHVYLDGQNPPIAILNSLNNITGRQLVNLNINGLSTYSEPRPNYSNTDGHLMESWEIYSSVSDGQEIISNSVIRSGNDYYYGESVYSYFIDFRLDPSLIEQADLALSNGNISFADQLRTQARKEFKRYEIENANTNGFFYLTPPNSSGFRPIKLLVENNKIIKWIIYDETVKIDGENVTGSKSTFKNLNILPDFWKENTIVFNLLSTFFNPSDQSGNLDEITSIQKSKFRARISHNNSIIDSTNIINDHLITNNLYSSGEYGFGYRGDDEIPDHPSKTGYLRRNQLTELDVETYYIIEAVKEIPDESGGDIGQSGSGSGEGGGFYRLPHALGIVPSTIKMTTSIFTKLIPSIKKLIKLINNPSRFVTEIVQMKSQDHFTIFNSKSLEILSSLSSLSSLAKSSNGDQKKSIINDMKSKVKNSEIGNYVYVDENGGYKFLLDGTALIGFFGLMFGLKLDITNNDPPIKPIVSVPSTNIDNILNEFKVRPSSTKDLINNIFSSKEDIDNYTFNESEDPINKIKFSNGDESYYEEVSIEYSTGKYIEGVNYKYIYINQEISRILYEADDLSNNDDVNLIETSILKYEEAYDLIDKNDGDSTSLKKEILDKIKRLKEKVNLISQPVFKFILGIVTLPLKIIMEIINWMLSFFKKLTNPTKIPGLISEFLSFDWILKFFTPKGIFEMAGIKFNPEKVANWYVLSKAKKPNSDEFLLDDDYPLADLNQFLSVAFESTLPIYTAKQYRDLGLKPFRLFSPLLCLFERIINGFIMLVWSTMGITAIIPPPLIRICNRINENIDISEFNNILNGVFEGIVNGDISSESGYTFSYEVKMEDGSIKTNLDKESIQKFIDDNRDVSFEFINFETIE